MDVLHRLVSLDSYIFFFTGIYSLISSGKVVTLELDKNFGKITIAEQLLFYKKISEQAIRTIVDVEIAESSNGKRSTLANRTDSNQIVLILKSGHALPLNLDSRADWRKQQKTVSIIREFLGLAPK